jgi:hypothetical protein
VSGVYTSLNSDGSTNPNALNIELDLPLYNFAAPLNYAKVKIWGISLSSGRLVQKVQAQAGQVPGSISEATDLNGADILVSAGMAEGLPLANPKQYGPVLQGKIFQAFGNWVDTDMTVDMFVTTDGQAIQTAPTNLVVHWKKNHPMSEALETALRTAYPQLAAPKINISSSLVWSEDFVGHYQTIEQLAQHINQVSLSIITSDYNGVDITLVGNGMVVYDGTVKTRPIQLIFTDMIGQPTWISANQVQVSLVMRSDITVGDFIKFPPFAPTTATEAEFRQQAKDRSLFQGVFMVNEMRHVGNFRQPSANSWITVITANTAELFDDASAGGVAIP